jgi:quercetin dioxygenase-like cupin family protein
MKTVRWYALILPAFLVATASAAMLAPATAFATQAVNTEAVIIAQATVDGIDYVTREITIAPGGSTGWHYHDGRVFGVVRAGTLTRTMADCAEEVTPTGVGVAEASKDVHIGRNLGPVPTVLWVLQIAPVGTPWSFDVARRAAGSLT